MSPIEFQFADSYRYWECCIMARGEPDEARRALIWSHWTGGELASVPVEPQAGYYRVRQGLKGERTYRPVAIVPRDDTWSAVRVLIDKNWHKDPLAFWERHSVYIEPVTYEAYKFAYEKGKWPGDIGGSAPSVNWNAEDPDAEFRDELLLLVMDAEFLMDSLRGAEIDRIAADKLANFRERIGNALGVGEDLLRAKTAPLMEAAKGHRDLWRPSLEGATEVKARLSAMLVPFLAAQKAEGLEARVGGQAGRRTGVGKQWYAEITDWDLAIAALQEHPKLREVVQQIANSNAKSKELRQEALPGIEYKSRDVAR